MVNGPASGGEFPLGKEYWENQEDNKGYEYDSNKNVPKKTIKVPVGQTQQGEAASRIEQKFSAKDIAKLIKKYQIEKKKMDLESVKVDYNAANDFIKIERPATKALAKLLALIPAEDQANLTSEKAIFDYLKAHPELKQSIELLEDKQEEKPVIAEKIVEKEPTVEEMLHPDRTYEKPQIAEKIPQGTPEQSYVVNPDLEARPELKKQPVVLGSENDVPDEDKLM